MKPFHRFYDQALDASIYFSFDRSGYERHAEAFDPEDLDICLKGRRILVTGANSGLGRAAALRLAHLGAEVWLLCRNRERGLRALDDLTFSSGNDSLRFEQVDVADFASMEAFCDRLGDLQVDGLIHNAGILPSERRLSVDGFEASWATNVLGPFWLTRRLLPNLKRSTGARVINVTSGGMYTQRFSLDDLDWREREFDGVVAYAQTKRAEVILTELWAERLKGTGVTVNSMHPGWADTPAVREALPRFWRFTQNRLRSPRQGADTLVWLASCKRLKDTTGKLFFDRREAPTHLLPWTRESERTRIRLWWLCEEQSAGALANLGARRAVS